MKKAATHFGSSTMYGGGNKEEVLQEDKSSQSRLPTERLPGLKSFT